MEYRKLGHTDIAVSALCLGTMTWGEQNSENEAHEQLDYAFDQGVNFIDTAEMYPVPPQKSTYSKTEQFIGTWEKMKTRRDKIILATKIAGPGEMVSYIRGGQTKFNKQSIIDAVDASLKRLRTDYIDLYQLHWPDRMTNFFGQRGFSKPPLDDTDYTHLECLQTLKEIIKSGKIREIGLSNETPWGAMKYLKLSEQHNLPRVVSIQNAYNLLNRTYEVGMGEVSYREKCGLLAYSPLGFGVLSGKYIGGQRPQGARISKWERFSRYTNQYAQAATEKYVNLAKRYDLDPAQMALAFVTSRFFVTSNIIGATTIKQLKSNIESVKIQLSSEILDEIQLIHSENPSPSP